MPLFYSLRPLLTPFTPTLIYPLHHLPKPKSPFIPYGFNISIQEGKEIIAHIESSQTNAPKAIIIFVGGFCDTIMRAVYREFVAFNEPFCLKLYISFKCQKLFTLWLPILTNMGLPLFIIAHSWGASNLNKVLQTKIADNIHLHYLLTLDPVGYNTPHTRPSGIRLWENIYISHKIQYLRRDNIITLIGHAWNNIEVSDYNASLSKPAHHASINQMINTSHFYQELTKIIKS